MLASLAPLARPRYGSEDEPYDEDSSWDTDHTGGDPDADGKGDATDSVTGGTSETEMGYGSVGGITHDSSREVQSLLSQGDLGGGSKAKRKKNKRRLSDTAKRPSFHS